MGDYYTKDEMSGAWLDLKAPSNASPKRPVCPTCRAAITSARYGRVFKSSNLDILEKNVISQMTKSLAKIGENMGKINVDAIRAELRNGMANMITSDNQAPKQAKDMQKTRRKILQEERSAPIVDNVLDPSRKDIYAIPPNGIAVWNKATFSLKGLYRELTRVASIRSAHHSAWEASFSCLFEAEINRSIAEPVTAPRNPNEHAMRVGMFVLYQPSLPILTRTPARMKVGQLEPRADKRFLVETFWLTIRVRSMMVDLLRSWIDAMKDMGWSGSASDQLKGWGSFGLFLARTSCADAKRAFEIAESSGSRRQMTSSMLYLVQAEQTEFVFNVQMTKWSGFFKKEEEREKLLERAAKQIESVKESVKRVRRDHARILPDDVRNGWIVENFDVPALSLMEEWEKLEKSIRMDTFYEPVSTEEKMAIVKSFDFGE
jgi:hypothetical protein